MLFSFIFHNLVRKKEKLSREGSRGWDFNSFGQLFCCLLLLPPGPCVLNTHPFVFFFLFFFFFFFLLLVLSLCVKLTS